MVEHNEIDAFLRRRTPPIMRVSKPSHRQTAEQFALFHGTLFKKRDGTVKTPGGDFVLQFVIFTDTDIDMTVGMMLRKGVEGRGHHIFKKILRQPKAHDAGARHRANRTGRFVIKGDDPARISDQHLPGPGGNQPSAFSHKKRGADLLFEPFELHAECRLRPAQPHRRPCETAEIGPCHNRAQRIRIKTCHIFTNYELAIQIYSFLKTIMIC